jgi:glc operon protein GlcG
MSRKSTVVLAVSIVIASAIAAAAQQPAPAIPEKMPFDIPYGNSITVDVAEKVVQAAEAEARKRDWKMAIAVVSPSGDLIYFKKMENTQLVSSAIAPKKARSAARFRRPTQVFYNAMETGHPYVVTLDPDVVASPGGIPLIVDGKLVGGIGCSGGTGDQDHVVCTAGANSLAK